MARSLIVDTDVMIDYLRGHPSAVDLFEAHKGRIVLSTIVVAELYAGVKGDRELAAMAELEAVFQILPVTTEVARIAGLFKRDYAKSHGLGLIDAIVAATAQAESAELATLNVKHFPMFPGLRPPYAKS